MIETLMEKYSEDIRFVYRDFPLNSHQNALQAAQAANCAGEQNSYWEMHNLLFSHQDRLSTEDLEGYAILLELDSQQFMECLQNNKYADEIQHDMADAQEYQVSSTPTFFINGHRVIGADLSQLEQTIDGLLGNQEE
jgi:protein-disulfide isomerase